MPYEIAFTKRVQIPERLKYCNDCCVGGDVVLDQILPALQLEYHGIFSEQEDWGWFAWFLAGNVKLAVDVFCDDADAGEFRIHLTSSVRRVVFGNKVVDTPELDRLCKTVMAELAAWLGETPPLTRIDATRRRT